MGDNGRRRIERRSIGMYPEEWLIVDAKARELAEALGESENVSQALRLMVKQWKDLQERLHELVQEECG